jgi:hypothetical protein
LEADRSAVNGYSRTPFSTNDVRVRHYAAALRLANAPTSAQRPTFDGLTIGLHWATVLFVLAQFASAWLHTLAEVRQSDFTPVLLQIHRSIGVTIWVVTALRLA